MRLNLDSDLPEHLQMRQQRANEEYLQQHQQQSKRWAMRFAVLGLVLGLVFAVMTPFMYGIGLVFALQLFNLGLTLASLRIMQLQEHMNQDTTRTEEERQLAQDRLSLFQGILALAGFATCYFDVTRLGMGSSALGVVAFAAQATTALRLSRMGGLVRAAMRLAAAMPSSLRILQLPSFFRTVDRVLAVFGANGARLSQLGMTTWTRIWTVVLDVLTSAVGLFRSLLNLFQSQSEQNSAQRDNEKKEKQSEGVASNEVTQERTAFYTKDRAKNELIRETSDLNSQVQEVEEFEQSNQLPKGRPPPKRSQAVRLRFKYTPQGGEPVEIWFEGNERRTAFDWS